MNPIGVNTLARIRTIKPEFWADESISTLSLGARLLSIALLNVADDEGRLRGNTILIHAQCFPYDPDVDIRALLDELLLIRYLIAYQHSDQSYFWVRNFLKHQKINRPKPSLLPVPPGDSLIDHGAITERSLIDHGSVTDRSLLEGKGREGNGELPCPADAGPVGRVFSFWKEHLQHPTAKLDGTRERAIRARLKDYSVEQLCDAIRGCKLDPFSMGQNDRHTRYDNISLICRDAEHVEKFIALTGPGNGRSVQRPNQFKSPEEQIREAHERAARFAIEHPELLEDT